MIPTLNPIYNCNTNLGAKVHLYLHKQKFKKRQLLSDLYVFTKKQHFLNLFYKLYQKKRVLLQAKGAIRIHLFSLFKNLYHLLPMLPFQKLNISDLHRHLDQEGRINSVISICGFLLCQKGWAKVKLGEEVYTIGPGDLYIYVSSTFIHVLSWSPDLEGIVFKSTLNYILPFVERATAQRIILNIRHQPNITLTADEQKNIVELSDLLDRKLCRYNAIQEDTTQSRFLMRETECLAEALFTELFLYYTDHMKSHIPESPSHKDKIVYQFVSTLFKNYKREREVQYYAEQQFLTPRYFSSIIKERTGKSALAWISEMVTSHACQLLSYSDMSIKEIALSMNFPNQSFFGKYFKQYMHCSPLQYRQKYQEQTKQLTFFQQE